MPAEMFIPPVQPIAQAPQSFVRPGEQRKELEKTEQKGKSEIDQHSMILLGAVIEALIRKNIISEEDVLNAIADLQEQPLAPKPPEGGKPEGGGYPGAADTHKSMGEEIGKMSPARHSY